MMFILLCFAVSGILFTIASSLPNDSGDSGGVSR